MTEDQNQKELRIKNSGVLFDHIRRFSATEKVLFSLFLFAALISTAVMAYRVNNFFIVEVPTAGGELREGVVGLPRTVNPILAISDIDRDLSSLIFAGLTRYEKGAIVPDIAKSWTVSPDGLTYDFTLRDDLEFSDGSPLLADDVVFTIQKIQDPALKSPRRADWNDVTVTAISPTHIRFVLKQPYTPFITNTTVGIIPKHLWNNVSDGQFIFSQYNTEPIGAGPYKLSDITRDGENIPLSYHLQSWQGHRKKAFINNIVFYFFDTENEVLAALNEGTIDSAPLLSPSVAKQLSINNNEPYTIITAPLPRLFGIFLNQNQSPVLAEKSVRQALDKAIDRQNIIDIVLSGYGTLAEGPLPNTRNNNSKKDSSGDVRVRRLPVLYL